MYEVRGQSGNAKAKETGGGDFSCCRRTSARQRMVALLPSPLVRMEQEAYVRTYYILFDLQTDEGIGTRKTILLNNTINNINTIVL